MDTSEAAGFTAAFLENRGRLERIVARRLDPRLAMRVSHDDILQETFIAAQRRRVFFEARPDVPVYFKFRTVLLQVLAELERRHLGVMKRDPARECRLDDITDESRRRMDPVENMIAAETPSPATRLAQEERHSLLRQVIGEMPQNDRQILSMRHFDGLSNLECAEILSIEPKAASIRYARALMRLRERLAGYSEFKQ